VIHPVDEPRPADQAYAALADLLEAGGHGPNCAMRCLRLACRADHECYVCAVWADAEAPDDEEGEP
jgi:hypothetical protein